MFEKSTKNTNFWSLAALYSLYSETIKLLSARFSSEYQEPSVIDSFVSIVFSTLENLSMQTVSFVNSLIKKHSNCNQYICYYTIKKYCCKQLFLLLMLLKYPVSDNQ